MIRTLVYIAGFTHGLALTLSMQVWPEHTCMAMYCLAVLGMFGLSVRELRKS